MGCCIYIYIYIGRGDDDNLPELERVITDIAGRIVRVPKGERVVTVIAVPQLACVVGGKKLCEEDRGAGEAVIEERSIELRVQRGGGGVSLYLYMDLTYVMYVQRRNAHQLHFNVHQYRRAGEARVEERLVQLRG